MTAAGWKPPPDAAARTAVELLDDACRRVEDAIAIVSGNKRLKEIIADLEEEIEKMARVNTSKYLD